MRALEKAALRGLGALTLVAVGASGALAAVQEGHGEAGGGGLFSIDAGLMAWTILVFLALLFVLTKYAWGPILSALDAREERIRGALEEARQLRDEARSRAEEQEKKLREARHEAQEILAEGREAAERLRDEIEAEAREESEEILRRARREIGRERDEAFQALRNETADIALAAAAKLMGERMDRERDRELVDRYLEELASDDEGVRA